MRILVIGGLGYIGSDLSHKLNKFGKVTILDSDIFGSDYKPTDIEVIKSNVLDKKLDFFNGFDKIVISSDIDNEEFYQFAHYQGYLSNYRTKLKEIANSEAEVYYLYGYLESQEYQKAFMEETIKGMAESVQLIKTPNIYGDNVHVRSDTFVNCIIKDFIMYGSYTLNVLPSEIISFCSLFNFTEHLVECIIKDKAIPDYDQLPALLLANLVHWSLNDSADFNIGISKLVAEGSTVPPCNIRYTDETSLRHNINMMYRAITDGMTSELTREHSDHGFMLRAAMKGYGVTSRLLSS